MLREYFLHPSFRFEDEPLSISEDLTKKFNSSYKNLVQFARALSIRDFHKEVESCTLALEHIFGLLISQANNEMESIFLTGLLDECSRLLRRELGFIRVCSGGSSGWLSVKNSLSYAAALHDDRFFFDRLDADVLAEIMGVATPLIIKLQAESFSGAQTREKLSINSGYRVRRICSMLNGFFKRKGILDALSAYIGCRMVVSGVALELSVPHADWWKNTFSELVKPPKTLYAHLDESIAHPKSIIYLTDVSKEKGPTSVFPEIYERLRLTPLQDLIGRIIGRVGSQPSSPLHGFYKRSYHQAMSSGNFRRHYMRLPEAFRFNSHFGWDIVPDGKVEKMMLSQEQKMLGPAGTLVVFDGSRLIHRGGLIQGGQRIVLQVIFSDSNIVRKIARRFNKDHKE